ncbi:double-strand break repair helicase AddA [Sphingorhabdus arenilitoris]|uniref:DNA 3'-5' helicase n=1 Tax=Sphingorhabdus arenilitoris TaxID=1490041 RepID=A0ABV8RF73_9SPHN
MSGSNDKGVKQLFPLTDGQEHAVVPGDNIWLSASAGTGKTQVLTARVIRLLLEDGVRPENLLCVTFTKAGAAEMSERINERLASWVQMPRSDLACDLMAIGADYTPPAVLRARQLFAQVLDAPGGGLQILTIHSLCQSLLASFPDEAGLIPGFEPVEGRERDELYREALYEMIIDAEQHGRDWLIQNLQQMSLDMNEERAFKFLQRCAAQPDAMERVPDDHGALRYARRIVGLDFTGSVQEYLEEQLSDSVIDKASILALAEMNREWGGKKGTERAEKIAQWLALDVPARAEAFDLLRKCWTKADGDPFNESRGSTPLNTAYSETALALYHWSQPIWQNIQLAAYADRLAPALLVGKAFARQYQSSKQSRGLVDFDDMIRKTADLLNHSGMADWVRYKLDRQFDHILVDEAQDTNKAQWDIVTALSDDFFSGAGGKGEKNRTIFAVGDYKQAIFSFQGTDPENYRAAGEDYAARIQATGEELQMLELSRSFRSTKPVLHFVNSVIDYAGPAAFGITRQIEPHHSEKPDSGHIELFAPVLRPQTDDTEAGGSEGGDDEEKWLSSEQRILSHRIAAYVRSLVDEAPILASHGRALVAGDIMILLRKRGDMASFLVSQLHDKGVPVAGIDRLRLQQPLCVQDILSVIRFVLQPGDDLSLASVLVSPLVGWSQDELLAYGYRGPAHKGKSLWQFLRANPAHEAVVTQLSALLNAADYIGIYAFMEQILSGPMDGRRKFIARMGEEVRVPLDELLNAGIEFEQRRGGTLQTFLAWFERGDTEIKREGIASSNEVRVMTVHGSKGLQAPVVILADILSDPDAKKDRDYTLTLDGNLQIPLLPINKDYQLGQLGTVTEQQKKDDLAEHHRLLYVAMTRAEERLIMAGAIRKANKDGAYPENSWYPILERAMENIGCRWEDDPRFGQVMRYSGSEAAQLKTDKQDEEPVAPVTSIPDWLMRPAPAEEKPPRPLVPSHLDDDDYGDAPASLSMQRAAEKGRLIHALFERITGPDLATAMERAKIWLERNNRDSGIDNDDLLETVRNVIANPHWHDFFGSDAKSEIPLAAVVGETVITGRVDRLHITDDRVRILDFKTGRNIPSSASDLPRAFLRQMAHYQAAVEKIFPGRTVEAYLLFTHGPVMMQLDVALLAPHRPV